MTERRPDAGSSPLPGPADLPPPGARVHLMGIAGAGMRGLAVLLADAGYRVSGCDRAGAAELSDLVEHGIYFYGDHAPDHVEEADLLIRSSAVPLEAPELEAARSHDVRVMRRARALGALLNGRALVGVAGTHGKTTITAMTGSAADAADLDPTVVVGGRVTAWGGFARPGSGPAVVEADEYDRSFLELDPTIAIVSSLEPEHLDTYGDFEAVEAAFAEFAGRAERVFYCADDAGARRLGRRLRGARGYGFDAEAWCRIERNGPACRFTWPEGTVEVQLAVPGRHNRQNAAAAFVAVLALGGEPGAIVRGLEAFAGVGRRLEVLGTWGGMTVIDDYAHHPTEVAASLAAVREGFPGRRVRVVFQPHLYSRTRDFAAEFASALGGADEAWVLPIYPAREAPIEGVTSELIIGAAPTGVRPIAPDEVARLAVDARAGDVLVFMGAGDVTRLAREAAARGAGDAVGA